MFGQTNLNYKLYWQKQGMDSLCGVHCINSLLQGPYFDEISLSHLALDLDKKQQELMAEQGITGDLLKYMKQESGNVAMDGNYSIQVLQSALKTLGLSMISVQTMKKEEVNSKVAFICNSSAHWIAIRKINGCWFNLNSLGMRLPEVLSDFYLSACLTTLRERGYQIFSVEGEFPKSEQKQFDQYNDHQEWYPAKRIAKYQEKKMKRKNYQPNITGGGTDKQMQKAIALSLGKKYQNYKSSGEDSDWDDDNKKKQIKPFTGTGVSMSNNQVFVPYEKFELDSQDVQLITIMKMTVEQKFKEEVKEGVQVIFKLPDGKKRVQIFKSEQPVSSLYDYIWACSSQRSKFYLVDMGSKNQLLDLQCPVFSIEDPSDHTAVVHVCEI